MTNEEIIKKLAEAGKKITRTAVSFYLKRLNIEHVGAPQRPQQYPADTAERIIKHLGLAPAVTAKSLLPRVARAGGRNGILTLKELKAERSASQKARAAR